MTFISEGTGKFDVNVRARVVVLDVAGVSGSSANGLCSILSLNFVRKEAVT